MAWFFENIFKIIYVPFATMIFMANMAVIFHVIADAGFKQPYAWICIIIIIAYAADIYTGERLK